MTADLYSLDTLVIPNSRYGLYDHRKRAGSRECAVIDAEEVERRVAAGEWLRSGAIATLFGVARGTVHNWIRAGKIRYRPTIGRQRLLNPDDVLQLLAESREIHQDKPTKPEPTA